MTREEFIAFYPQFASFTPAVVMDTYITRANERFTAFAGTDAEEARRLYTAHKLTLYAGTALPENGTPSMARIAEAGRAKQKITGKKAGEVPLSHRRSNNFGRR